MYVCMYTVCMCIYIYINCCVWYLHLLILAYEVLSDPDTRRTYDMYGAEGTKQGQGGGSPFDYNSFFHPGDFPKSHFSFSFDDFFGDDWRFGDDDDEGFFGDFFGNTGEGARRGSRFRHDGGKSSLTLICLLLFLWKEDDLERTKVYNAIVKKSWFDILVPLLQLV